VGRYGIRGLVIDPYNELDHQRAKNTTETEYVSQLLTKLKRFAQHYRCVVCPHPGALNQELPVGLDGGFCVSLVGNYTTLVQKWNASWYW
jgi:hypothetical protein